MATSFSGGGSQGTRREPPSLGKQLVNFITCGCEWSAPFCSLQSWARAQFLTRSRNGLQNRANAIVFFLQNVPQNVPFALLLASETFQTFQLLKRIKNRSLVNLALEVYEHRYNCVAHPTVIKANIILFSGVYMAYQLA